MTAGPDIAIVLTAAINVAPGSTAVEDGAMRRQQYLAAAHFYARFAPVYFLENSGYDLRNDPDFNAISGVRLRPIAAKDNEARGKGYREFHALDLWCGDEAELPGRILKVTGRYLFNNISDLLRECREASPNVMLFDRLRRDRVAITSLFSLTIADYRRYIRDLYRQVDDPGGVWIEHVVYRALENADCRFFRHEPDVRGISGSSGKPMQVRGGKLAVKQAARSLNRILDRRYLHLHGAALRPVKDLLAGYW